MIRGLLILSLIANVFVAYGLSRRSVTAAAEKAEAERVEAQARIESDRAGRTAGEIEAVPSVPSGPINWASLPADQPEEFLARLQAAGVPSLVARQLLYARLNESLAERRRELIAGIEVVPYYKTPFPNGPVLDADAMAELRAISSSNNKIVTELAGPDPHPAAAGSDKIRFGSLSPEKIEQVKAVLTDYDDMRSVIGAGSFGAIMQEDKDLFAMLYEEQDNDIRALLTPAEFEEYKMRTSLSGNAVRLNMSLMSPTEEEFRAVYPLQAEFDKTYNPFIVTLRFGNVIYGFGGDPRLAGQREAAQKELTAAIAEVLGPERGAEYEKVSDSNYRNALQLVTRLQLPPQNATELWQMRKTVTDQARAIESNPALDLVTRRTQLETLRNDAEQQATDLLGGQRGFETYRSSVGQWLDNLVPDALQPR